MTRSELDYGIPDLRRLPDADLLALAAEYSTVDEYPPDPFRRAVAKGYVEMIEAELAARRSQNSGGEGADGI
jgi:hypothetical protein